MNFDIVILAAGMGVRTKLPYSKLVAKINGKPMIYFPLKAAIMTNPSNIIIVTNKNNDGVEKALEEIEYPIKFVKQQSLAGTADALKTALRLSKSDYLVVINGDMPLLRAEIIKKLLSYAETKNPDEAFIYTKPENPGTLGRVFFEKDDFKIVEASETSKSSNYVNAGLYLFKRGFLEKNIDILRPNNNKKELYITDLFNLKANKTACFYEDWKSLCGVNSLDELEFAGCELRSRKIASLLSNGVIIYDGSTLYIEEDAEVGRGTLIYPHAVIKGKSRIGENCVVESFSTISDSALRNNVTVKSGSYIEGSLVKENSVIGPMAHLRPGSIIGKSCKVGNFVETKKAVLEQGVKASHLSYLGDCQIGKNTNIGCGTITCNYDGFRKYKTEIGSNVFIGSDSQLVAPVRIGNGSLIAAGSTVVKDVPDDAMAISRAEQKNIEGAAKRFREKRQR